MDLTREVCADGLVSARRGCPAAKAAGYLNEARLRGLAWVGFSDS